MGKVVVVGGGWAGVSAALCAQKAGAEVILVEKTDVLLGAGNVGGIFRNNGRYTAAEEMRALGAGELFEIMDNCALHKDIDFPGHKHASLYDVGAVEPATRGLVADRKIPVLLEAHVKDVKQENGTVHAIVLDDGTEIAADAFVEATGSSGPQGNCQKFGHGCSMCIQRCPTFGPRVSLTAKCGIKDLVGTREDGTPGVFSGACKIDKKLLDESVRQSLDKTGVAILQVPQEDVDYEKLGMKACKQYALKEYSENVILLDTGAAKLMTCYYPLEKLRKIPGMERAQYSDPYSGGRGNSIRYLSVAPCLDTMQVDGLSNLFCGGEKGAALIGHTEAVITGALAGHNAARSAAGKELLVLPDSIAVGDIISCIHEVFVKQGQHGQRYTFAGGVFFERMKERGLYTTDVAEISKRIQDAGLSGIFDEVIGK